MTQNGFGTPPIFSNLHKKIVTVLRSETYQAIMIHLGIIIRFLQAVKGNPEKRGKEKMEKKNYIDYIVEETKKILAIDSPSGYTKEVAEYVDVRESLLDMLRNRRRPCRIGRQK